MRILVTGGAGFIGSHLCEGWLRAGATVTALDDLSTGSEANLETFRTQKGFRFVQGSACEEARVGELVGEADLVYHLAAAVGVRRVLERPRETFETNMEGTRTVLRAAARDRTRVVFASSSEVYGRGLRLPFREDDPLLIGTTDEARWTYAFSKAAGEALGFACSRETNMPFLVVRLFNTVGPRQTGRYGMVLPRFVGQAVREEPITVYGDGRQTRSFIHVRDTVRALMALSEREEAYGRVFNVGGGREISIEELARFVREIAGSEAPIVHMPYREAYGTETRDLMRRRPDTARLSELLGEPSRISLEDTIDELVACQRSPVGGPSSRAQ